MQEYVHGKIGFSGCFLSPNGLVQIYQFNLLIFYHDCNMTNPAIRFKNFQKSYIQESYLTNYLFTKKSPCFHFDIICAIYYVNGYSTDVRMFLIFCAELKMNSISTVFFLTL